MQNIKEAAAQPVLDKGRDAVVPIILDGENAWEYYPQSGREFLRRFYDALERETRMEAVTVSEAIARHKKFGVLTSLVPGSWINANFNVWIGAPEDNRAWDYLYHARNFYEQAAPAASEAQRKLAFEEILIAEGSDWNWWYGPEHHSANDREFDELYRKHLSNVYQALGATPPDYLAQPIIGGDDAAFVCAADGVHPSACHRRDGPLLRVDGRRRLYRRPPLRRRCMASSFCSIRSMRESMSESFMGGWISSASVPERTSNSW